MSGTSFYLTDAIAAVAQAQKKVWCEICIFLKAARVCLLKCRFAFLKQGAVAKSFHMSTSQKLHPTVWLYTHLQQEKEHVYGSLKFLSLSLLQ